jgi:hypothetical protein
VHIESLGHGIELPFGELLVGRDVTCALRFDDLAVSRRHLRFIRRAHQVFVEDLGSSNGTFLNGRPIRSALPLADGDTISLGSHTLIMRMPAMEGDDPQPSTLVIRLAEAFGQRDGLARQVTTRLRPMTAETTDVDIEPIHRRRHDRKPIELQVVYTSPDLVIETTSNDLSESGVFVCSQVLDPIGTECRLSILVEPGPALDARGIVRRVVDHEINGEPIGLGIEFVDLGAHERASLLSAIARLSEEQIAIRRVRVSAMSEG